MWKKKTIEYENVNDTINILRSDTTLYTLYYILIDVIQMTSNYSTIDVEEESNRVRKCKCHNHYS